MHFFSWNVNGIRSVLQKGFLDFVQRYAPDVLCLQEVKAHPEQVELALSGYHVHWNAAERKGYSGTAVLSTQAPLSVRNGMGIPAHDTEGRIITLEFAPYFLVNVYTPNVRHDLCRLVYRQQWDADFRRYLQQLEAKKPVIVCGDLNVAHEEIDLARPKENVGNPGFTDEERAGFRELLAAGFLDTFREFTPDPGHYSWWSYRTGARPRNVGWRIDYFCLSQVLRPVLRGAAIRPEVLGSDHCPVSIEIH